MIVLEERLIEDPALTTKLGKVPPLLSLLLLLLPLLLQQLDSISIFIYFHASLVLGKECLLASTEHL